MADVFLSYSSKDRPTAEAVQKAMAARGFDVFWDQQVPAGTDWDTWIRAKLSGAKVVVVLWSRASIASQNVRHEAMIGQNAHKLIPVMIDAIAPEDMPMGLYLVQGVQLLDWRNPASANLDRLGNEIAARLGQPAPAPKAKPSSGAPMIVGALVVLALVGGGVWWALKPKPPAPPPTGAMSPAGAAASPSIAASDAPAVSCPGGGVPILGVCPAPGARLGPDPKADTMSSEGFARRMLGHWRLNDAQKCREGPNVTMENGQLVFTTPGLRFVHVIEADAALSTRTRVLEPAEQAGHIYVLTPEFFATSDGRSFNLVVEDKTAGTRDTWSPCVVKS